MARALPVILFVALILAMGASAAPAESSANHGASLTSPPAPSGPYEQTAIRRSGPSAAPTTQGRGAAGGPSMALEMSKVVMALGGVILLILALRAFGKKMVPGAGNKGSSRAVQVLVKSTVSPRQQLMLIQVGRRLVLVGSGGAEMNPLCQIDDPDEVAEVLGQVRQDKASSLGKNFRSLFGKAEKEYDLPEREAGESPDRNIAPADGSHTDLGGLTDRVRRIAEQFGET